MVGGIITRDNGIKFVGVQRKLCEKLPKLDDSRIKDGVNPRYLIWKFNPPSASWIGGAMEPKVKITKNPVKANWLR